MVRFNQISLNVFGYTSQLAIEIFLVSRRGNRSDKSIEGGQNLDRTMQMQSNANASTRPVASENSNNYNNMIKRDRVFR